MRAYRACADWAAGWQRAGLSMTLAGANLGLRQVLQARQSVRLPSRFLLNPHNAEDLLRYRIFRGPRHRHSGELTAPACYARR